MTEKGKKRIFISDWQLQRMLKNAEEVPANAIISPLSYERILVRKSKSSIKTEIIEIGLRLYKLGFVPGTDGNISVRLKNGRILITASGVSKGTLEENDVSEIDIEGNLIEGKKPSSEYMLHLCVYRRRPDVNAVVHAHPPVATAFASCGRDLSEPLTAEIVISLGKVPLAPYAVPGSRDVAESIVPYVGDFNALLLANHGVVAYGENLEQAFHRMEIVEHFAKIIFYAEKLGEKKILSPDQVKDLDKIRKTLSNRVG